MDSTVTWELGGPGEIRRVEKFSIDSVELQRDARGDFRIGKVNGVALDLFYGDSRVKQPKYRTVPEGDMLRAIAVAGDPNYDIEPGEHGGLIHNESCLSQDGSCWVDETSRVGYGCRVSGDAHVNNGSTLSGSVVVGGNTRIDSSDLSGYLRVDGEALITHSTVSGIGGHVSVGDRAIVARSQVTLSYNARVAGSAQLSDSVLTLEAESFVCGRIDEGRVNALSDTVMVMTPWGPLTGYPREDADAGVRFTVGCQERDTVDDLRDLAAQNGNDLQCEQLECFISMVKLAAASWGLSSEVMERDGLG